MFNNINNLTLLAVILRYIAVTLMALLSSMALAVTCTIVEPSSEGDYMLPLAPANISVGPDMPNGTVVYRYNYGGLTGNGRVDCNAGATEQYNTANWLAIDSAPYPISAWASSPFAGKVYQTNIPGIGVALWFAFRGAIIGEPALGAFGTSTGNTNVATNISFDISLIKIGDVSPGMITGNDIPTVSRYETVNDIFIGNFYRAKFSGSINITTPSCQTPDVTIDMGTYDLQSDFSGVGSTTPWKDGTFNLVNCPVFYGYYDNSTFPSYDAATGNVTVTTANPNIIKVSVSPYSHVIDSANGVFALDSISDSALGVALQLGYGDTTPTPMDLSSVMDIVTDSTGTSTINLPFHARYIQTENVISPGIAKARLAVNVEYR
ncbi:MAG: fimbrial protein [Aeromonas hydrophila]